MTLYKRCFGHTVIKGQFVRKDRARRWAIQHFGADAKEGYDFELVQSAAGKWAAEPGPKYDKPACEHCETPAEHETHLAWETVMGMRGYTGSAAERESRVPAPTKR